MDEELEIVLIDTWWNVNESLRNLVPVEPDVLIDTWWNVNGRAGA